MIWEGREASPLPAEEQTRKEEGAETMDEWGVEGPRAAGLRATGTALASSARKEWAIQLDSVTN